jgi:non-ribosomal peptide synthetase component E (peptide arylation enzyme)
MESRKVDQYGDMLEQQAKQISTLFEMSGTQKQQIERLTRQHAQSEVDNIMARQPLVMYAALAKIGHLAAGTRASFLYTKKESEDKVSCNRSTSDADDPD